MASPDCVSEKLKHARRALLYVPGSDLRKIEKAAGIDADSVCLDLEDGVALNRKGQAREMVARVLRDLNFGRSERLVRINSAGSSLEFDDLTVVLPARPDGIVVPKVETADQVREISESLAAFELAHGWVEGSIYILAIIESARGILNLAEIAASKRLVGLVLGAEDLAADMGAIRTIEGQEIFFARSTLVTCAAAFELQAIDAVFVDYRDLESLREETRRGLQMGFCGKQVIHPAQVPLVQEVYTPDEATIEQARRIIDAFATYQAAGSGAFALDGKMVDMPVVKAAQRILARARAAGKYSDT